MRIFVLCFILVACSGQNERNNDDSSDDSNADDISRFPFSLDDFFDGRPWRPPPGVGQQSPRRQLVYFMSVLGQIFNQTEELGGKLSGVGDLIKELQDAINEDSDQDVIDSFADFLQTANEHLGSLGLMDVQFNITGIVEALEEMRALAEGGIAPSSDLTEKYILLLMEPFQKAFGIDRRTPGLNPSEMGPNRKPGRRARGCSDIRTLFPERAQSIEPILRQARASVENLIEHIGPNGLPITCVKEILRGFRPGQCNPGHIRSVVCKVDADPDILRGLLNCLEQQDICGTLEHLKTTDCVTESKNRRSLAGMLLTYQCGKRSITVDVLARAPLSVFQTHVLNLQTEEFKQLLHKFRNDLPLMEEMSCYKKRFLTQAVKRFLLGGNPSGSQSRFAAWKKSMDELVGSFYKNSRQPSPDEIMAVLSDKLDELSSLIAAVGETGLELPDFEGILMQIRSNLETSDDMKQVDLENMLNPVYDFVRRLQSPSNEFSETLMEIVQELKPLLPYMPREVCSQIPTSMILSDLEILGNENFKCFMVDTNSQCEDGNQCGRAIVETIVKHHSVDLTDEEGRQMMGNLLACVPKQKLLETARPGNCAHFVAELAPAGTLGRMAARQCLPEDKDLGQFNWRDVQNMGCLVTELGLTSVRQIPRDAVCQRDVFRDLSQCLTKSEERDNSLTQFLMELCSSQITRDTVEDLGPAVVQASQQALRGLRQHDLTGSIVNSILPGIQQICEGNQLDCVAKAWLIQNKLNDIATASKQEALMKTMSLNQFKDQVEAGEGWSAVQDVLNLDEGHDPSGLQAAQRQFVIRMLMSQVKHPREITDHEIVKIGSLVMGLGSDAMLQLNPFSRLRFAQQFASFDGWNQQQTTALRMMLKEGLMDLTENNPWNKLTEDMVQDMHPNALLGLIAEDIEMMTNKTCNAVCRKFDKASHFCAYVPRIRRKSIALACMKCIKFAEGTQLSEEHLDVLGETLLTSLDDESVLDRIPDEILIRRAKIFSKLHRSTASFMQKLTTRIVSAVSKRLEMEGDDTNYGMLVEDLGLWALAVTGDIREKIRNDLVNNMDVLKELLRMKKDTNPLETAACREGWSEAEIADANKIVNNLRESFFQLVQNSDLQKGAEIKRRKRETSWIPTCADLKSMDDVSAELTTEQINAMSTSEVDDCMTFISSKNFWSDQQYNMWSQKFSQVIGQICTMSSVELRRMGIVAYTLSENEISCLENLDDDAVASLGRLSQWSKTQLAAFASKYIQGSNLPSVSKLTADHVANMGHFLCGLTASDIRLIPNEVYEATSSLIGNLQKCDNEQLEALAAQARRTYGDASLWDPAIYADVGIVIGGLDGKDLAAASYPEIEVWTPNAIAHIQPEAFKELNNEQLGWFTRPQAQAVTAEQKGLLTNQGKEALEGAVTPVAGEGNTKQRNNKPTKTSGAGHTQAGLLCVLYMIFIHMFL